MVERDAASIDWRDDRSLADRYGFLGFAIAGSIGILAAKYFVLPTWIVAVGAMVVMLLYALAVNIRGTGKLRSDQAGDNCYYLGLIFTLTSLAYAIFTFDPEDTATTIVQGFGIALATTILGLVLRVFFSQSRVDLYEIEDSARLNLAEAAGELRAELSRLALDFKDFAYGLKQSVSELRDEARLSIEDAAKQTVASINELSQEVSDSLKSQSQGLAQSANELAKKTASVSRSLERHSGAIDTFAEAHELISGNVKLIAKATESMKSNSETVLEQARAAGAIQATTRETIAGVDRAASRLSEGLASTLQTMSGFQREFATRLKELENGPKDTTDKALAAIAKAAESVEAAMTRLTSEQQSAISSVGSATEELLKMVRNHNTELERELGTSRENVQKVHSALVDMTAKLTDTVR